MAAMHRSANKVKPLTTPRRCHLPSGTSALVAVPFQPHEAQIHRTAGEQMGDIDLLHQPMVQSSSICIKWPPDRTNKTQIMTQHPTRCVSLHLSGTELQDVSSPHVAITIQYTVAHQFRQRGLINLNSQPRLGDLLDRNIATIIHPVSEMNRRRFPFLLELPRKTHGN
jgi:hypothetical protein